MTRTLSLASLTIVAFACAASAQTLSGPSAVTLSAAAGTTAATQTVSLTTSSGTVPYSASSSAGYLLLGATSSSSPGAVLSGTAPGSFVIFANPTGLSAGTYTGFISVAGGGTSFNINVTFVVSTIGVSPSSVQFTYQQNSSTFPNSVPLQVTGANTTQYTVQVPGACTWLVVNPLNGTTGPGSSSGPTMFVSNSVLIGLTPNTYTCAVTFTPANSTNTPFTVPVSLVVGTAPTITATPASISMNYQIGFGDPTVALTLTSNGSQSTPYTLTTLYSQGNNWISLSKTSGTLNPPANTDTATVTYNTAAALGTGTYTGQIIVNVSNVQVQSIPVTLVVSNSPLLNVTPSAVNFTSELNGSSPAPVTVEATTTNGQGTINIGSVSTSSGGNWLSASTGATITTPGGTCPAPPCTPITVTANSSSLPLGTYKGTIPVFGSNTANTQTIAVTLTVANDALISTNVSTSQPMIFAYQTGGATPANQTVTVSSSTGASLTYTATATNTTSGGACGSWLSVGGGTTGNTTGSFSVSANPSGISAITTGPACTGTITITATNPASGNTAPNSPYTIPVNLFVSTNALLVVTPNSAPAFSAQAGIASSVVSQNCASNGSPSCTLTLTSTSTSDPLTVTVSSTSDAGWLSAGTTSSTIPLNGSTTLTIVAAAPGTPGSYSGTVRLTATTQSTNAVVDSPILIPVTLQVIAGAPTVSPNSLSFTQTLGGATPPAQTLTVGSSTGQPITFTAGATTTSSASWLTVTPVSGTTPGTLSVTVSAANLTPSTTPYQGTITITGGGSSTNSVTVPVSFTVGAGTVAATPASLTFTQPQGGSAPAAQTISVTGTPGAIGFTATAATSSGGNWLTVSPATGTTPGSVSVTVNAGTLSPNTYNGTVVITSPGAAGSPITIPVTLTVVTAQTLSVSPSTLTFAAVAGQASPSAQNATVTSSGSGTSFTAAATTASGGNWLTVTPTSGVTPAQLTISVATQTLAAGSYTGTVTISSPNAASPSTITVNLTVSTIPTPVVSKVQNAASYSLGGVSPGENIYIAGAGIGPATLTVAAPNASGVYPTTFGNTQVFFDNTPAPILYVSATATSVMVPYEIAGRPTTNITVVFQGVSSAPLPYSVVATAPGIYSLNQSGTGPGAILNQNFSVNGPTAPAATGSIVAVYMTGEGVTSPPSTTGVLAPTNGTGLTKPVLPVTATIGGVPATVNYYGTAPGIVYGVMQVNVTVPAGVSTGAQPLVITVGNQPTQTGITINVQAAAPAVDAQ